MEKRQVEVQHLSEIFAGVKADLRDRQSSPKYPTYLTDLDRLIWGFHKKELMVIGARPSQGKTGLAMQLAFTCADSGHNALFISLEMSKEAIVERLFCNVTRTNNLLLREGKLPEEVKKSRIPIFEKMIDTLPLLVVDKWGYNFTDVETLIKEMSPKPDIVFLDYIQLISQGKYYSKMTAIEEYFRKLKELSVIYDFSMVVLSQIHRIEEKRRPTMDELKGAGALEEHADTVLLLYWIKRNEYDHADINEFEINIAKQRHGPVGIVKVNFYPQYYYFQDRKDDEEYET